MMHLMTENISIGTSTCIMLNPAQSLTTLGFVIRLGWLSVRPESM
jgi:hypothetical protein